MIHVGQFRAEIVRPALKAIDAWSDAAENLVVGTAIQESRLTYLRQFNGGPARGLFQIEPNTHDDVWKNYIAFRNPLFRKITDLLAPVPAKVDQLETNLFYAAAMCRIIYLRVPQVMPQADDLSGLAKYWDDHYNANPNVGFPAEWVRHYQEAGA